MEGTLAVSMSASVRIFNRFILGMMRRTRSMGSQPPSEGDDRGEIVVNLLLSAGP